MKGYLLIFFTVLLWGTAPILDKIALKNSQILVGIFVRSVAVFSSIVLIFTFSQGFKLLKSSSYRDILLFALSGIGAGLLGMFSYYGALKYLPSSKVVPLCSTYPLVSAILAFLFLNESLTLLRILGIILIIIGIWLVK